MVTEVKNPKQENEDISSESFNSGLYHLRTNSNQIEKLDVKNRKKEIHNFIRKYLLTENLNIFIGSGCSYPAVPLMGETFKKFKKTIKDDDSIQLGEFGDGSEDIEAYLDWLNTGIRYLENSSTGEEDLKVNKEKLQNSFDMTKGYLLDSITKDYEVSPDYNEYESVVCTKDNYIKFYDSIFSIRDLKDYSPVNIFTTNYDLFNEVAMESLDIHYTNGFKGTVKRTFDPGVFQLRLVDDENRYKDKWSIYRKYVKLYKMHGSIDWKYDSDSQSVIQVSSRNLNDKDVLIYPTLTKHQETQQTPYSELFRALTISLQKPSSTLIVMGYGFPDEHINHLISQSLMNNDFTLIVFGNLDEINAKKFYEKHKSKSNFHFIGGTLKFKNDAHHFHHIIDYISGVYNEK